ncbi:MAG: hypothetical protein ACJAU5_000657, partial [Maricaulis maris]
DAEVDARLEQILGAVRASARQMPSHADFIANQCAAPADIQLFQA